MRKTNRIAAAPPGSTTSIVSETLASIGKGPTNISETSSDLDERVAWAGRKVMEQTSVATTWEKRQAATNLVKQSGIRLGDKSINRLMASDWDTDRHGPAPSARSVRRWCAVERDSGYVPRRSYGGIKPSPRRNRLACEDVPHGAFRPWLPGPGQCSIVDGSRIVATQMAGAGPIYRIDAAEKPTRDHQQGHAIAAEAELARIVAADVEDRRRRRPDVVPPWRRRHRPVQARIAVEPKIGDPIVVGGQPGLFLGRTLTGRIAVAEGALRGRPPRRRMRTYPFAVRIDRDPTNGGR